MTHTTEQIARHDGHWRPRFIDADFYDTRTALALIRQREGSTMYRAFVGLLVLIIVLLSLAAANG